MTMPIRTTLALLFMIACATPAPPAVVRAPSTRVRAGVGDCGAHAVETLSIPPDASIELVVQTIACSNRIAKAPVASDRWYVRRHVEFEEQNASALVMAAMVVACVSDGSCDPAVDPESFGYVHAYATGLDPKVVQDELDLRVTNRVAAVFTRRLREALAFMDEGARRLDARRRAIFVDLPLRVRAGRLAHAPLVEGYHEQTADLLLEIDTTLLSVPPPDRLRDLIRQARGLREVVLQRCSAQLPLQDCMDGPVVRPITERLVQLAISLGDGPQAAAEYEQLKRGSDRSTFAVQLGAELAAAVAEYQAMVVRYEKARAEQWNEVLLAAAFGTPPPQPLPELAWSTGASVTDYASQLRWLKATERVEGIVRGSRGRGDTLQIDFQSQPSVLIAISEARLLRVGEKLEAIVDRQSRRGVVLFAYKTRPAERVVQVRGMRLSAR